MQCFFDENPYDLQALRHDRILHTIKVQEHLGDVPEYIVPNSLRHITAITNNGKKSHVCKKKRINEKLKNPLMVAGIDYAKKRRV